MRRALVLVMALAGCSDSPVLSGGLGEREHGGLMFFRTAAHTGATPELYRLPPNSSTPVPVAPALRGGTSSSTSADGEWFAWLEHGVTWVRFLRNSNERRLTPADAVDGAPRLSHDGRRVILMRTRPAQPGGPFPLITTVEVDNLQEHALHPDDGVGLTPALSPDGQWIVWRSSSRSMGLELLSAAGDLVRVLVPATSGFSATNSPVFSPDGLYIAFVARFFDSSEGAIVVINLFGDVLATWRTTHAVIQPTWSPDGTRIAACLRPIFVPNNPPDQIVIWELDSDEITPIANDGADDCFPSWGQ